MNIKTTLATLVLASGIASATDGMDKHHDCHASPSAAPAAPTAPATVQATDTAKSRDLNLDPTVAELKKAKTAKNKICPVDKAPIGSMGEPAFVIWTGQAVALSCAPCKAEFAKDPAKYTAAALGKSSGKAAK